MEYQSSFHHNDLLLQLLHPLTIILISLVWKTSLKQKKSNLIQHLKIISMRSKIVIWKVSPPLPRLHQSSHTLTEIKSKYDCECFQKIQSSTNATKITILDMDKQGYTFIITRPWSEKIFYNFLYQRRAASDWPYRIFLNTRTASHCLPSLLKYLGSSMKTFPLLGYLPEKSHLWSQ